MTLLRRLCLLVFFLYGLTACTERRQEALIQTAEERISQNRYPEAVDSLRKAVALNPESMTAVKALYKLGFILETYVKDVDGALFNYQEFVRLSQDKVSVYEVQKRVAGLLFEQQQDNDRAIAAYKKLLVLSPDSLEADSFQFRIAQAFFRQNKFDQARIENQALIDKYPKSQFLVRARFDIGNTYFMEGKYEIAVEALKQVLRLYPQSEFATEAQFLIAQCLEHQEKLTDALQVYESIQTRYSSPDIVQLRIKELRRRLKQVKPAPEH